MRMRRNLQLHLLPLHTPVQLLLLLFSHNIVHAHISVYTELLVAVQRKKHNQPEHFWLDWLSMELEEKKRDRKKLWSLFSFSYCGYPQVFNTMNGMETSPKGISLHQSTLHVYMVHYIWTYKSTTFSSTTTHYHILHTLLLRRYSCFSLKNSTLYC